VFDAVVVGGGIAGLVAARELALRGVLPLVLEAWGAPGGAVGRHTVAGLDLDAGADSFATRDGIVAALATELGLGAAITAPSGRGAWVQLPSGPGTLPRTGVLGIPRTRGRRTSGARSGCSGPCGRPRTACCPPRAARSTATAPPRAWGRS